MIPIDVVLLPPEEIQNLSIEINRRSQMQGYPTKPLGKEDYVPHITLIMGLIEGGDLPEIIQIVKTAANETKKLRLSISKFSVPSEKPDENSVFVIDNTREILELHERLADEIKLFLKKGVEKEMLYGFDETGMSETTEKWINTMIDESSYENYQAHITLRCGKIDFDGFPVNFEASELAIFHLGDGCTCRNLIKKFKLID